MLWVTSKRCIIQLVGSFTSHYYLRSAYDCILLPLLCIIMWGFIKPKITGNYITGSRFMTIIAGALRHSLHAGIVSFCHSLYCICFVHLNKTCNDLIRSWREYLHIQMYWSFSWCTQCVKGGKSGKLNCHCCIAVLL